MFEIKHIGGRPHPVTGDQYNAFEVTQKSNTTRSAWPDGPLFPVGHTLFTEDGKAYEIVASRTVQERDRYSQYLAYVHSYLCREADPISR